MKINRQELYKLYMDWVEEVADQCDWKTEFGPEEIVNAIASIIENNPSLLKQEENYFIAFYLKPLVSDEPGISFRLEKKSIKIEFKDKFMEKYGDKMKFLKLTEQDVDEFIKENQ